MSGGGDTKTTVVNTNIPEYAEPYFTSLLDNAEAVTTAEYTPYGDQRLAGISADSLAAYDSIRNVANTGNVFLGTAADNSMYNIDASRAATQQNPYQFSATGATPYTGFNEYGGINSFNGFDAYGGATEYGGANAYDDFNAFEFGPAGTMTAATAGSYMSPYMQNVVDVQQDDARRQFDISQQRRDATAVQNGAFGGSRGAVVDSLAEEDLMRQLGAIQATGSQNAYEAATSAYQSDRAARMDVEGMSSGEFARVQGLSADEAARVQGMSADEAARVQGMDSAEYSRMQSALAAEAARVQGLSLEEYTRVQSMSAEEYARVQGISVEEAARVQAAQASEDMASKQFYLEGLGFSSEEAARLAGYGAEARTNDIQSAQLQEQIGKSLSAYEQAGLDIGYDDFLRQQGYAESQVQLMSSILQGQPIAPTGTTTTYTPHNPAADWLGAGISAAGLIGGLST